MENEDAARERARAAEAKAKSIADKAKGESKEKAEMVRENSDHPVIVGNYIAMAVIGTVLGVGAYQKYTAGQLTGKVVGIWAGVVGVFAVGDYYLSQ